MSNIRTEFFVVDGDALKSEAESGWKIHRAANVGALRYRCPDKKVIEFESINGEIGRVSWHPSQGGKWGGMLAGRKIHVRDANRKSKKRVLSEIATAKRDAEREVEVGRLAAEIQRLSHEGEQSARQRTENLEAGEAVTPRKRNKLSNELEPLRYEIRRVIPSDVLKKLGRDAREPTFVMVPIWLLHREEPTLFEKIAYGRLTLLLGKDGTFTTSLNKFAVLIGTSANQAEKIIRSLRNRNLIREIGRGARGVITHEFLWHPWMEKRATTQLSWVEPPNLVPTTPLLSSEVTERFSGEVRERDRDVSLAEAKRPPMPSRDSSGENNLGDEGQTAEPRPWGKTAQV